jgi:hypothetical protein
MCTNFFNTYSYLFVFSAAAGNFVIPGIQCGKVWIGVQPLLGVEGDPMRLLFERDLTPHPQVPTPPCAPKIITRPRFSSSEGELPLFRGVNWMG